METGDTRTQEAGEAARHGAKVVRLPREWLGPRDELVPIQPPLSPNANDEKILSAAAFWSEESAALQGAVQGQIVSDPPSTPEDPVRLARPGKRLLTLGRDAHRARWAMLGAAAAAVLVMAAIGSAEAPSGGGSRTQSGRQAMQSAARGEAPIESAHTMPSGVTGTDDADATAGTHASRHASTAGSRASAGHHRAHPGHAGDRSHRTASGTHRTAGIARSSHDAARSSLGSSGGAISPGASSAGLAGGASSAGSSGAVPSSGSSGATNSTASTPARPTDSVADSLSSSPSAGSGLPAPDRPPPP